MFENIINQKAIYDIKKDVLAKKIPQSILFCGNENTAKLTTAMELARVLSCTKNANWSCDCNSCKSMQIMKSTDLLIIGYKDFVTQIKAASKTFLKMRTRASSFLFTRSLKKLLLRFDPRIWDKDENIFLKATPLVLDVQELLNDTFLFLEKQNITKLNSNIEKILTLTEKIQDLMSENISVNQVRKVSAWTRLSSVGKYKFLIVENAELMQESARAVFLKMLEEPPNHVFFILTTTRPSAIMPTILSRLRRYNFLDRESKEEVEIVNRVFHDTVSNLEGNILNQYFQKFLSVSFDKIQKLAFEFWVCLFENYSKSNTKLSSVKNFIMKQKQGEVKQIDKIIQDLENPKNYTIFKIFLGEIFSVLQKILKSNVNLNAVEVEAIYIATKIILKWKLSNNIYNLSQQVVLESIAMEIGNL